MQEGKSTLYSYAIISQPIHDGSKYMWQKNGKYKKLSDAEKAIIDLTKEKVSTLVYRIVPYFEGYWWTDAETEKQEYKDANTKLWAYLFTKGLSEDARVYLELNRDKNKKRCVFF